MPCDFCHSDSFEEIYEPIGTRRAAKVAVCNQCGLVFTRYGNNLRFREPNPSGDADWGNVRYAKAFRLDSLKGLLLDKVKSAKRILDVGASRGDFIRWARELNPKVRLTAIEPDERLCGNYPPGTDMRVVRLEGTDLPDDAYDLVYCCQSLEHMPSPSAALSQIRASMKVGGTLFLEVPNLAAVGCEETVEEFMIDKHSFHFYHALLPMAVSKCGFLIDLSDGGNTNIRITATKLPHSGQLFGNPNLPTPNDVKALIRSYAANMIRNRAALPAVAQKISDLCYKMRTTLWGATTIFDLLVRYGGLKPEAVRNLVDSYVCGLVGRHHGVLVQSPNSIRGFQPDCCIILARFSEDAIAAQARGYGVRNVIRFSDLLRSVL